MKLLVLLLVILVALGVAYWYYRKTPRRHDPRER
jgi:hypothetical protein